MSDKKSENSNIQNHQNEKAKPENDEKLNPNQEENQEVEEKLTLPQDDDSTSQTENKSEMKPSQTEEVSSDEKVEQSENDEQKEKVEKTASKDSKENKENDVDDEVKESSDEKDEDEQKGSSDEEKNQEEKVKDEVKVSSDDENEEKDKVVEKDAEGSAKDEEKVEEEVKESSDKDNEDDDEKEVNESSDEADKKVEENEDEDEDDVHHKEIEDANAEDSEDEDNVSRHDIELKDYDAMSMDELVLEIEKLLKNEKVQAIRDHVTQIKIAFDKKFNDVIEEKKDQFVEEGGNVIDFYYSSPVKTKFNRIYFDYREKRDSYYKNLKKNLNENLKNRLGLIEELKGMIGTGRDMKVNFNHFKELQERWKNAGPVPRTEYSQLWKTYHHHVERFYDFLHLDREFRDLDFQHNLDQKLKIIARAEELVKEDDINRAFRELQLLHKMWKEELGPVAREFRDEIWDKFSEATKQIHDNRRSHFEELDKEREKNLEVKLDVVKQIEKLANIEIKSHKQAQKNIKIVNELRELFFKAGKVPQKDNESIWKSFKENVRNFNRTKNSFYKGLKQQQSDNLEKKLELIKIAEDNKDSDDFETTTPLMKKIQADWKNIGFVPRKHSDKIWKQFKAACNHYFDKFHDHKNEENKEEFEAFNAKKDLLEEIKKHKLKGDKKEDLKAVKSYIDKWTSIGLVPSQKRYIEGKFNKALDQFFQNMKIDRTEAELLKYENRLHGLEEADDDRKIYKEEQFLRTKITDTKAKINQFENNLQFFSNADKESPLVKEVYDNIEKLRDELEMWKTKLTKIKSL